MKPKYNFFKNTKYALSGIYCMLKSETSFRIELFLGSIFIIIALCLKIDILHKILLILPIFLIFITECINSAIERCVDLVTKDYHILAKEAKDIGSCAVFLSICLCVCIWVAILVKIFILI
ncbi:diacylglycerol kinase [Campylobacter sp. RM12327]|uniref:diacylglycerol kinase n=1 Tax=Campylobacter sputorum TaxID=206 RepID=UPI000B7903EA|nr:MULTISPECIES: diacylglycerol kinase [Campylobacter]ASM40097.1 diacylglycerol kinase [Campylobacter sputorum]MBE7358144.1 diacylglycerol kinase [Campylobacter sp. RM11302]MBF6669398.1 diacylglycerol kinase [Campylobacter sp. RM12327]MBF6674402.1 diacylglycerol kinase [Campylobacter sp. RM13538]MBF6676153.1 diacylglycerol kinase [Campylobacter sp. RM12321]